MQIKTIFLSLVGIASALVSLFFCYYTVRLLYLNLTLPDAAAYRSIGMYIGAVVFPVATIVFGAISWLCLRISRRAKQEAGK